MTRVSNQSLGRQTAPGQMNLSLKSENLAVLNNKLRPDTDALVCNSIECWISAHQCFVEKSKTSCTVKLQALTDVSSQAIKFFLKDYSIAHRL